MKSVFFCRKPDRIKLTRLTRQLQLSRQRKTKSHSCTFWNNKNPHEWRFARNLSRSATETFIMEGTQLPGTTAKTVTSETGQYYDLSGVMLQQVGSILSLRTTFLLFPINNSRCVLVVVDHLSGPQGLLNLLLRFFHVGYNRRQGISNASTVVRFWKWRNKSVLNLIN